MSARVVLANIDYRRHMTSEGDQFQEGLGAAGWTLCGTGYDGLTDVPTILDRYQPDQVIVHDKRDWDPASAIAFRKDLGFARLSALQTAAAFKAVVVKDAATSLPYQAQFFDEAGADAAIVYYHPRSVEQHSGWLQGKALIRTYHSVNVADLDPIDLRRPRGGAVVSGAVSKSYPLRQRVVRDKALLGIDVLKHPGYGNAGSTTPAYLRHIARYKVHIATASMFGFALRKMIESVAVGCTVITDLPAFDVLPAIDGALIRVKPTIGLRELRTVISDQLRFWDLDERLEWSAKARDFYDYRSIGRTLDLAIAAAAAGVAA
jgi:hypothetical protein